MSKMDMSERFLELRKDDPGSSFGFNIKGGIDVGCPVYIWRVEPNMIAGRQGMKSGDEIVNANGIDFRNITHTDALKVLKSQSHLSLIIRSNQPSVGDFRGEFYTWVDKFGNPVSPPKEIELARAPTRLVDLQIDPGQNLGLMIRGGCEYGLGIYVTGVDPGSVAERAGLQRGDQILQVNSRPFTNITHDKAVQTLKSSRKMTLTLAYVGKIPADLTYEPKESMNEEEKSTSVLQMIEEKARTVLTKSEHSRFTFYRLEYCQGFLPVHTFVRILLELLNTHEKYTLLTEVREIIRKEDRMQFDELIYKPAEMTPSGEESLDELITPLVETNDANGDLIFLREFRNPGENPERVISAQSQDLLVKKEQQQVISTANGPAVRFRVRLQKSKPILGIAIEGGSNTNHRLPRIISVNPDGSAFSSNLKAGQVILSVDGKKLDGLTHEDIARVISECYMDISKHSIDFTVVENSNNLVVLGGGVGGG